MSSRIELDSLNQRIEEVIGQYVKLKRSGKTLVGLCPFHQEKTPSFSVVPGQCFNCFGCGAKGDVFTFVMRIAGVSFPAAKEIVANGNSATPKSEPARCGTRQSFTGSSLGKVIDWDLLSDFFEKAAQPADHQRLSESLGVSVQSLQRLRAGICGTQTWAFPMVRGASITGIRVRRESGDKFAISGTKDGLFVPRDLNGAEPLVICEGPTDTAAMLDLGLSAIGRSNCEPWNILVTPVARGRKVVIVADADSVGQSGAAALRDALKNECPDVRIVSPVGAKDAREWKRQGLTREQFMETAYGDR
jgi:DNA primase